MPSEPLEDVVIGTGTRRTGTSSDYAWEYDQWMDAVDAYDDYYDDYGSSDVSSDGDEDPEEDIIIVTAVREVYVPPVVLFPTSFIFDFNFQIDLPDLGDLLNQLECLVVNNHNDVLQDIGSNLRAYNLTSQTFDALEALMMGSLLFGDEISDSGFSLADLTAGLGDLTFYDGPTSGWGRYFQIDDPNAADPHSIIIDTESINDTFGADPDYTAEFLMATIIHEIGHAQDSLGASTPWNTHAELTSWARRMSSQLDALANEQGFDTFEELIESKKEDCDGGHQAPLTTPENIVDDSGDLQIGELEYDWGMIA